METGIDVAEYCWDDRGNAAAFVCGRSRALMQNILFVTPVGERILLNRGHRISGATEGFSTQLQMKGQDKA